MLIVKYFVLDQQRLWAVGTKQPNNYFELLRTFPFDQIEEAGRYAKHMNNLMERAIERLNKIQ